MSRMATVFAIIILSLAFDACIDPYTKETPANPNILTVNGMITTEYGPHEISLTYANQFSNTSDGNRVPIREAKVTIEDDLGREVVLEEALFETTRRIVVGNRVLSEPSFLPTGRYQTPADFRAEVGRTYTLRITTATNERYSSLPEKLLKTPNLDSIEIGFYNTPSINPLIENKGVELIAHFTDPPDERNFYFWNLTNGHMALIAEPHLNQAHLRGGGQPITCCEICYMEELRLTKNFTITNDFLFDGLTTRQVAARIHDNGIRFKRRYRIMVNQFAVSESAYRFLQLVRQQLDIQGSVFDPPPANIRGNIINLDAPERQALGYFFVVEPSSSDMIYINRSDIPPEYRGSQQIIADDCRAYESRYGEKPTLYPPDDWEYN